MLIPGPGSPQDLVRVRALDLASTLTRELSSIVSSSGFAERGARHVSGKFNTHAVILADLTGLDEALDRERDPVALAGNLRQSLAALLYVDQRERRRQVRECGDVLGFLRH